MEVNLPEDTLKSFKLVNSDKGVALAVLKPCSEYVVAGGKGVTERADIPLNTAGEPRISDSEVAGLDYSVSEEKILLVYFVVKGVQSAAVLRQKLRLEVLFNKS